MKNSSYILLFIVCCLLYGCTEEEMETAKSPYMGNLHFSTNGTSPDSLYLIAERIVNFTSYAMAHSVSRDNGHFIYNCPSSKSGKRNRKISVYPVQIGNYIVCGVNCSSKDFTSSYLEKITTGGGSSNLLLEQRTYNLTDKEILSKRPKGSIVSERWNDNNAYSKYITPLTKEVVLANSLLYDVEKDKTTEIQLDTKIRSVKVNIRFTIKKDLKDEPFRITMVETELSGIPGKLEIHSGKADCSETYKVFYNTKIDELDTYDNTQVKCAGEVNVLSLQLPKSVAMSSGPGILQIMVHVRTQSGIKKVLSGKINLYNTIKNAKIAENLEGNMLRNLKDQATLDIKADCIMSSSKMVTDISKVTGIDSWQAIDEVIIIESDAPEEIGSK